MATVCNILIWTKRNPRCVANLHCECQELKPKVETNNSFLVLYPSSGVDKVKAGVDVNRSEIWGNIKGEMLRLKWIEKHYQTLDHPEREPLVGSGLFGIRLLILHVKLQFSKSIKSSTFHIFLNLTYPLRKNTFFQKCPNIYSKPPNSDLVKWSLRWNLTEYY